MAYFSLLSLRRQCAGAGFCVVGVELLFVAFSLETPVILLFRLFVSFADLAVLTISRFHLEIIEFQSLGYNVLFVFNLLPTSLRTLLFVGLRCCVVVRCLADCATSSSRLRLVCFGHLFPMPLPGLCPTCFLAQTKLSSLVFHEGPRSRFVALYFVSSYLFFSTAFSSAVTLFRSVRCLI